MGAQGIRLPDRAFWDRYLTLLQAAGIKPGQARWYLLRVEQYLTEGSGPEFCLFGGNGRKNYICNTQISKTPALVACALNTNSWSSCMNSVTPSSDTTSRRSTDTGTPMSATTTLSSANQPGACRFRHARADPDVVVATVRQLTASAHPK